MKLHIESQTIRPKSTLIVLALSLMTSLAGVRAADDPRAPELPSPVCDTVNVEEGNRVSTHAYALGVQIYRWSGTNWVFAGPVAALFSDACYSDQIGTHYGTTSGPAWEADDGSKVIATRYDGCTPFRGAIPWLLLKKTATFGDGEFSRVTWIQRVNTIGGTAPAEAGAFVGDEARVPYTAEYYFYRATKN
jgi:hypothetical protein